MGFEKLVYFNANKLNENIKATLHFKSKTEIHFRTITSSVYYL